MKAMKIAAVLLVVCIGLFLVLTGCQPAEGESTGGTTGTTGTTQSGLLQVPSSGTGDNEVDLFGPDDTDGSTGSTTSTETGDGSSSTTTTTTTGNGKSTSPYDNEQNWVDGPIPTR